LSAELKKTHSFRLFFGDFAHWVATNTLFLWELRRVTNLMENTCFHAFQIKKVAYNSIRESERNNIWKLADEKYGILKEFWA